MTGQKGLWDEEERLEKLGRKKPCLRYLTAIIPWEEFRPLLEGTFEQEERKSPAGRKRIDVIIMFKMLVLQHLFNLSDEELEFQVNDRRSFEEFVGMGVMDSIPDATTVWLFRERLRQAGVTEELFQKFDAYLKAKGLKAQGGQIIDATIVPVPKQRNRRKENEDIKQGKVPENWQDNPKRLSQKDLDARWTKKNEVSHYGYKNSISIDVRYGLIRRQVVTPANVHDSQMLPALLDPENREPMVWADAAYGSKQVDSFLKEVGYESRIQEKGSRQHPLDAAAKERNRERSKTRSRVEHVFAQMEMSMGGKLTRCIGLARVKAWWCLRNLVFNFLRFTQHEYGLAKAQ